MPPTVIIKVDGAIGIPQPPAGPNIPTELIPTQQRLDDPLPADGGLYLGVDVDVVEQDQPATAPVGVHDAVLIHRPGDGMDQEGREGQVLTGRLTLPQQPLGIRDVNLHQTVNDVLSLGGGEQVGIAPTNLQERPGLVPRPASAGVAASTAVTGCSARASATS